MRTIPKLFKILGIVQFMLMLAALLAVSYASSLYPGDSIANIIADILVIAWFLVSLVVGIGFMTSETQD